MVYRANEVFTVDNVGISSLGPASLLADQVKYSKENRGILGKKKCYLLRDTSSSLICMYCDCTVTLLSWRILGIEVEVEVDDSIGK